MFKPSENSWSHGLGFLANWDVFILLGTGGHPKAGQYPMLMSSYILNCSLCIFMVTSHYPLFGTRESRLQSFHPWPNKKCQGARHTSWRWWRIPRRRSAGRRRKNRAIQRLCWTCRRASPAASRWLIRWQ